MSGRFITFEGGEGAGKTTQLKLLAETLRERGVDVHLTREPGGSPGAEEIRRLLVEGEPGRWDAMTETLLMFAARRDHVARTVWPALSEGKWVLCDRFADSTLAYQGAGHGLPRHAIEQICATAIGGFAPDLTIILDLPAEEGLRRAHQRAESAGTSTRTEDRFERMGLAFHQRLRQGFLDIASSHPERCIVIPALGDVERVRSAIWDALQSRGLI